MLKSCEITAVIPTYNRARFIGRALESVLGQAVQPAQVIVIDDGSSDETPQMCKAYAKKIHYEWQGNAGAAAARNAGVRLARCPWIAFLDSDDYWTAAHLERMVAAIQETAGEADVYFSDMQMSESDGGGTLWEMAGFRPDPPFHLVRDASAWMLLKRQPTMLQSSVIRKCALESVGGFDESKIVAEDTDLFCRLGIGGVACAVTGIGSVLTFDDNSNIRLTNNFSLGSEKYLAVKCRLWREVLDREKKLPQDYRRLVKYNLAGNHLELGKAKWRSGRRIRGILHLFQAAKFDPCLALWLLQNRSSKGYEETVRPSSGIAGTFGSHR
jgi:glycosyltransferase involved in cell wall biosynthesis